MLVTSLDVFRARNQLIQVCKAAIISGSISDELRTSVRELADAMRNADAPPELLVIAVKDAAFEAGVGPRQQEVYQGYLGGRALVGTLVTFAIEDYYRPQNVSVERQAADRPANAEMRLMATVMGQLDKKALRQSESTVRAIDHNIHTKNAPVPHDRER